MPQHPKPHSTSPWSRPLSAPSARDIERKSRHERKLAIREDAINFIQNHCDKPTDVLELYDAIIQAMLAHAAAIAREGKEPRVLGAVELLFQGRKAELLGDPSSERFVRDLENWLSNPNASEGDAQ